MHGRNREEYKALQRDTAVANALAKKALAWNQIVDELQKRRRNCFVTVLNSSACNSDSTSGGSNNNTSDWQDDEDDTTLRLNEKALTVNPDPMWLWNYRRELLLRKIALSRKKFEKSGKDEEFDQHFTLFVHEQSLTQASLVSNSKAYGAWFHRKWCILNLLLGNKKVVVFSGSSLPTTGGSLNNDESCRNNKNDITIVDDSNIKDSRQLDMLNSELSLTELFLSKDERNFHCWSYRRFIVSCLLHASDATSTTQTPADFSKSTTISCKTTASLDGSWTTETRSLCSYDDYSSTSTNSSISNTNDRNPILSTKSSNTNKIDNGGVVVWMGPQVLPTHDKQKTNDQDEWKISLQKKILRCIDINIVQAEWDFTTNKIHANFSNFSAFHYRSKLFPLLIQIQTTSTTTSPTTIEQHEQNTKTNPNNSTDRLRLQRQRRKWLQDLVQGEFDLLSNAIFTEPDDQTAWWYQNYLLDYFRKQQQRCCVVVMHHNDDVNDDNDDNAAAVLVGDDDEFRKWLYTDLLRSHVEQLRELKEEVIATSNSISTDKLHGGRIGCGSRSGKWILIGLLQCLDFLHQSGAITNKSPVDDTNDDNDDYYKEDDERRIILHQLLEIDPDRYHRYKSLIQKLDQEEHKQLSSQ